MFMLLAMSLEHRILFIYTAQTTDT